MAGVVKFHKEMLHLLQQENRRCAIAQSVGSEPSKGVFAMMQELESMMRREGWKTSTIRTRKSKLAGLRAVVDRISTEELLSMDADAVCALVGTTSKRRAQDLRLAFATYVRLHNKFKSSPEQSTGTMHI